MKKEKDLLIAKYKDRDSALVEWYECANCHRTNITQFCADPNEVCCPDCGTKHKLEQ